MSNISCRINTEFSRPDASVVELFRGLPVANIDDCMNRTAAVHQDIFPLNRNPLLGIAFTVKVPQGDNLMFHKAMDLARPGDVIVIDAGGDTSRAIFGGIMALYCQSRGISGLAVDGSIRDRYELESINIPVYARGVTPNGPYKNGPGEIGGVISFGGISVRPGDIVVGDGDGLIFIHPEDVAEVAAAARSVADKEAAWIDGIKKSGVYSRPWVDAKLSSIGCEVRNSRA